MPEIKRCFKMEETASPEFDRVYWKELSNLVQIIKTKVKPYDKILVFKNGKILKIEEKIRDEKYSNGDIVIEEKSNVEKDTAGWIYYSNADYLFYSWLDKNGKLKDKILCVKLPVLRMWYDENKYGYKLIDTNTDGLYTTSFRIIPIEHIRSFVNIIKLKEAS